jgi:hypothetical protein
MTTRRGAHQKITRPHRLRRAVVALVVIVAVSGLAVLLAPIFQRSPGPVAATSTGPTASESPSPSPATVTVTTPMSADELRAAFLALAAHERGYDSILPADALPSLAQQICSTVAAGNNAAAVWQAAGDLEQQYGLPSAAAWGFIDIAVTTYCPAQHMLVLGTTAAMGD